MNGKKSGPNTGSQKKRFIGMIQERILSGALKPGDRLPPERVLAAETGISRSSVNQGILDLERQGFLRIAPRKGTFVADYRKNAIPSTLTVIMNYDSGKLDYALFHDLMATRLLVERECARLACPHMTAHSAAALDGFAERMETEEPPALVETVFQFHRYVVQLAGNAIFAMIFNSFEGAIRNLTDLNYREEKTREASAPLYKKLVRALKAGEGASAEKAMAGILVSASDNLRNLLGFPETADFLSGRP